VDHIFGVEAELAALKDEMIEAAMAAGVGVSGINGSIQPASRKSAGFPWKPEGIGVVVWDLDEEVFKSHIADRGAKRMIFDYFMGMLDMVADEDFDCLSHLELIRKYDRRNDSGASIYFGEQRSFTTRWRTA